MKIRAISLNNVRRFTEPVHLGQIGDGLNVLCEANEYGKSTLFDALQALFFNAHSSANRAVKALQPHAGGAPEVCVEVETGEGRFVIRKRWLSKAEATIHNEGRLVAQADEAETWISRLVGDGAGGPSGLLWVRQGLTALSDGTVSEQRSALEARRDLLSSVTGEVEAMTGGRRMDAALERCQREIRLYATPTGRPIANGPWKNAIDEVADLTDKSARLKATADALHDALEQRKRKHHALAELEDPDEVQQRSLRRKQAEAAFEAARQHAERIDSATRDAQFAQLEVTRQRERQSACRDARIELEAATRHQAKAAAAATEAQHRRGVTEAKLAERRAELAAARSAAAKAETDRRKAQQHQRALEGAARRSDLAGRLKQAEAASERHVRFSAEAKRGPDAATMRDIEEKARALDLAIRVRASAAPHIALTYLEGVDGRVIVDGASLPAGKPIPVSETMELILDSIGTLRISPGEGGTRTGAVEAAEEALREALASVDASTVEEARNAAEARAQAQGHAGEARAELSAIAPDGLDKLREAIALIPEAEPADPDLPDLATAEARLAEAEQLRVVAQASHDTASERFTKASNEAATAEAAAAAASDRLSRAAGAVEKLGNQEEEALSAALESATSACEIAEKALENLKLEAPDLDAAQATLDRMRSVEDAANDQAGRLRLEIAQLNERISLSSGDAVEEELADTGQRLEAAEAQLARIEREVRILRRLEAALSDARNEARERYFEPVAAELKPLLHLIWPDAELTWGDDTLLPETLVRHGVAESVEILSGGTREQIALLVRLAFAKMLARNGRHAPVILDDALVFTDDDRIERMFDALHRQAGDLQIIVLSCRQRAFRELGGRVLQFDAGDAA